MKGLILLWVANAHNGGLLTRDELCTLVKRFNAENEAQILRGLCDVVNRVNSDVDELRKMYDFGFISCKETPSSRTVESEMCAQMLEIVLDGREQFHHVKSFIKFLVCCICDLAVHCPYHVYHLLVFVCKQNSGKRERVNGDEWNCVFNFCLKFGDDLSAYDDTSSCL